jgi:capsular exopolysaccharide synthesis family protein
VAAGFLLGLALIYFLNRLDDRLELAEDIESELDQPILGQIPHVDTKGLKESYLLVSKMHRHNMFSEAVRGVRSAIMLSVYQGRKQALLVSSAVPGDGKTTFTVNFAATLAIAGNRVLLIDADLRRGNIHNYFKLDRSPGFSEILEGQQHWTDVIRQTEIPTLHIIATGQLPPNPGELLVGPVTGQFIEEARHEFDYVVADCPPLTAIDDAFSLVSLMDGLLFVVRSGQTSMRFAKTALSAVRQRGANILGVILNGITSDNPYYYYNYYYHSYYNKDRGSTETSEQSVQSVSARKMAAPKARRYVNKSITGEAMAHAGQGPSLHDIQKEADAKAEALRAMRAGQKPASHTGAAQTKDEHPAPEATSGASGPEPH